MTAGWERQEARLAQALGATRRPGSGAFWSAKGDVRSAGELIEAKYTAKRQITISAAVLRKIELEAVSEGRMPVLAIEVAGQDYVVLSLDDFLELRPCTSPSGPKTPSASAWTPRTGTRPGNSAPTS